MLATMSVQFRDIWTHYTAKSVMHYCLFVIWFNVHVIDINPLTTDFLEEIFAFKLKNEYKIRILQKSLATIYFQKVIVPTNFVVNFGC